MGLSKYIYFLLFVSTVLHISCSKDSMDDSTPNSFEAGFSSVAVFNAIPNSTELTLSIGEKMSEKTVVTSSDNLGFGKYVKHRNWFAGSYDVFIQNQESVGIETAKKRLSLTSGKFYSLFLYRKNVLQSVLTEDNVILPNEGKVKIRLAHLSEGLSNIKLVSPEANSTLFQNISFGTITNFVEVDFKTLNGYYFQSDDGMLEWALNVENSIQNKGIYTILVKGVMEAGSSMDYITIIKQ